MSDIAIKVENLSKLYHIGEGGSGRYRYKSLRDVLSNPLRRLAKSRSDDTIWALKDVSFDIKQGEVVGIIGRNGAGKSTLLKILSRITEPTKGHAEIHGRIGSLLEVGTGFHPELTGRENIFLNGAILGMKRAEIIKQFNAIVAFAEVEKFIDTPVKHYSSGMYVRLAFAVAAHLEPEILIVDEVLAVGDAQFQKKCLGKMEQVAKKGRTVLFVSHNMNAIHDLCNRCILIDEGQLMRDGNPQEVTRDYILNLTSRKSLAAFRMKAGEPPLEICEVAMVDHHIMVGDKIRVRFRVKSHLNRMLNFKLGMDIHDSQSRLAVSCFSRADLTVPPMAECDLECQVDPKACLMPGEFFWGMALFCGDPTQLNQHTALDCLLGYPTFTVISHGDATLRGWKAGWPAISFPVHVEKYEVTQ